MPLTMNAPKGLRAPPPYSGLQVNFCRNATCENFGVPVDPHAPRKNPDDNYLIGKSGRLLPDRPMKCQVCGKTFLLKSNVAVAQELERISEYLLPKPEPTCPTRGCENAGLGVFSNPEAFPIRERRKGAQRVQCRACRRRFSVSISAIAKQNSPHHNRAVFVELVTKKPIRGIAQVTGLDPASVYEKIDFIHRQCLGFAGERERKLSETSHKRLALCVDSQDYMVNWRKRTKRKNVQFTAVCTVDSESGYVFAHTLNYDPWIMQDEIEDAAKMNGDLDPKAKSYFRAHPQYWLREEFKKQAQKSQEEIRPNLDADPYLVEELIEAKKEWEEALPAPEMRDAPALENQMPDTGVMTHADYTTYAHALLVARMVKNTKYITIYTDQDSLLRNAFATAFSDWIKEGRGEMAFVQFQKEMTVDEKKDLANASSSQLKKLCAAYGLSAPVALSRAMGIGYMKACGTIADPMDRWVRHPKNTMNEPRRRILYLTDNGQKSLQGIGWTMSLATLAPVDNYFMRVRRGVLYFERPVPSRTNAGRLWTGYQPYDPKRAFQLLDIFRVYTNYVWTTGGKTPAQRLGLARGPVKFEDILYWQPEHIRKRAKT